MANSSIKHISDAADAPRAVGPYSQATILGNLAFLSGQVALDPKTLNLIDGGIEEQTEQVFNNLSKVLAHIGSDLGSVVRASVYLKDMNHFSIMNTIFERRMGGNKPARTTIEVSRLPKDALIEIDVIATVG